MLPQQVGSGCHGADDTTELGRDQLPFLQAEQLDADACTAKMRTEHEAKFQVRASISCLRAALASWPYISLCTHAPCPCRSSPR